LKTMNEMRTTVLKIGGSVITDKNGDLAAKTEVINRLAEEIAKANLKNLIVVHGGGSFGHPIAQKWALKNGYKEPAQKLGFAETHHVMTVLNGLVMDALIWHEVPAVSVAPSCGFVTEDGRIKSSECTLVERMMKMGFTPVLYGDATLDDKLGFAVLSGDQLVTYLALKFNACKIVMSIDCDGLYDVNPKIDKNAKLYSHLALKELREIQGKLAKPTAADVTGGISGKVNELIPGIEKGIPVSIVNGTKPSRVYRALIGEEVEGTVIEA
jgi:isopentenyl phosphate kinase